jgi:alpha-maltose-1-phosphate synthase
VIRSVLLSHPHAASVAAASAAGLERAGILAEFVSGLAAAEGTGRAGTLRRLAARRGELGNRVLRGIPPERLRSLAAVEMGARLVGRALTRLGTRFATAGDVLFVAHDAAVSRMRWRQGLDAVYAYEDGALRTLERARRRGIARILDLPACEWRTADAIWREEARRWPGAMGPSPPREPPWKRRRKDGELALAEVVSVASAFARRSLEAAGCEKPVVVTPYGFPVEDFAAKAASPRGPVTVLSVGNHDLRKGTPYLLEAWRRAGLREARLRLIGPMRLAPGFLAAYAGSFEHVPHLPRSRLPAEYQAADLLAFPTLGDGFGLVIQEAMCCATPVVTTPCGGGPECIRDGRDGWIVPPRDIDALVEVLRRVSADREAAASAGLEARARADAWTWEDAGRALVSNLRRACAGMRGETAGSEPLAAGSGGGTR